MKTIKYIFFSVLSIACITWGSLAIYYSPFPYPLNIGASLFFTLASIGLLLFVRPKRRGVTVFTSIFAAVLIGWFSLEPSNDRQWQPDVAVLPYASISDDIITIHNIRNCDYRTETDYTVHYYDKTFKLSGLKSMDLFLSDWGLKSIVHTLVSFGFDDGSYLCFSIEARKEVGEEYSSLKGFFRQYEMIYVVGDERDLVRLRTNYRKGETVYLYRLTGSSLEVGKQIFLDYIKYVNRLKNVPEWYNALTGNCTTQIRGHTYPYARKVWWDWRILANGYIDELAYEHDSLDRSIPFSELKQRSIINDRARLADKDPAFSKIIRNGLPGMGQ